MQSRFVLYTAIFGDCHYFDRCRRKKAYMSSITTQKRPNLVQTAVRGPSSTTQHTIVQSTSDSPGSIEGTASSESGGGGGGDHA